MDTAEFNQDLADDIDDDDFAELDGLIAQSLAISAKAAEDKLAARKLIDAKRELARLNAAFHKKASSSLQYDISQLEQVIAHWETLHIWQPIATVAVFEKSLCSNCGRENYHFHCAMQRQQHRSRATTQRLIRVSEIDRELPREIRYTLVEVPICEKCLMDNGWAGIVAKPFEERLDRA